MVNRIREHTDTSQFENALKITISAVIPVLIGSFFGDFQMGFGVALGAILTSPADIPSSRSHKINGLIAAALIVSICTLIINYLYPVTWALYPITAALVFFLAMIPIYGHRANMVAFSGLLAISLSFGQIHQGWDLLTYSGLIVLGGLFYLLISLIFHLIRPHRYSELQLAECMKLTARYLKLRGDLWDAEADRAKIIEKQLNLQVELNTIHENIREVLIRTRLSSGNSDRNRTLLLVFISLVEIMELALSTSFDHKQLHEKFKTNPAVLKTYQQLAYNLGRVLKKINKSIEQGQSYVDASQLANDLQAFEQAIRDYETQLGKESAEGVYLLTSMLHYVEQQVEKIHLIGRAFSGRKFDVHLMGNRDRDLEKFLAPDYYRWRTFRENLSFSSTIFRHALRLTVTLSLALLIGIWFDIENVYWILLTIVVILKPGFGLTKKRSFHRIIGTLIGGVVGFLILRFINEPIAVGLMTILSMILGYTYSVSNYKVGVTFITIYVILLYGLLVPNVESLVEMRILDTAIGAALSFLASYLFWPSWEYLNVPLHLKKSIKANSEYFKEIQRFYNQKGEVSTAYRLARKNAFIETGNLMASFQRMSQEPKSKQKQLPKIYKLAVLNHTLLSASASLGTYIQSHKTTKASQAFNIVADTVIRNLDLAAAILQQPKSESSLASYPQEQEDLTLRFTELKNMRLKELSEKETEPEAWHQLQMETQLVVSKLVNLTALSEKILKSARNLDQD